MPTDKLELIRNLFEKYCPIAMPQQFLELSGGVKFLYKSVTKLREMVLVGKHTVISDESDAETSIRLLSEDNTTSCVSCTGSYDEATKLERVRRKRKTKEINC